MGNKEYVSFVKIEDINPVVETRAELEVLIFKCRKTGASLQNLDLTKVDVSNLDFSQLRLYNVIFNKFQSNEETPKKIFNVNFQGCVLEKVSFSYCRLSRCNFDKYKYIRNEYAKESDRNEKIDGVEYPTKLIKIDFFFCIFESCRFRKTEFEIVDFRYSSFNDCSLSGWNVYLGDFYMASFKGTTSFYDSTFRYCSLTNAVFEQHCPSIDLIDGLVQENYILYHDVLMRTEDWSKHNPCAGYNHLNVAEVEDDTQSSRISNCHEAYRVYATLSGIYNGKGLFRESNEAYRRAKENEKKKYWLEMQQAWRNRCRLRSVRYLWKYLLVRLSKSLGYGYNMSRVFVLFLILVLIFGGIYYWSYDIKIQSIIDNGIIEKLDEASLKINEEDKLREAIAFSLNNSLGPFDRFSRIVGAWWSGLHSTLGILLVGFLGFVMANRIRNNV